MSEIPIREENKRTLTVEEAQFILELAIDPLFDYYEGDLEYLEELHECLPPKSEW